MSRPSFVQHVVDLSRVKRQNDDCLDCNRQWSDTDSIFYKVREKDACKGKNLVVCKSCTVHRFQGVTDNETHRRGFTVYESFCFDTGYGPSFFFSVDCFAGCPCRLNSYCTIAAVSIKDSYKLSTVYPAGTLSIQ